MASPLAEAHIAAQARLRGLTVRTLTRIWNELPGYDRENVDEWLSRVLPVVLTAQRTAGNLTEAYLARAMDRQPFGTVPDYPRNDASPDEVYQRPFVTLWGKLGEGLMFADASSAALARATSTAAMDVQMAMAQTARAVGTADPLIQRFQRVADAGACAFCQEVDGAILNSDDAMPLHNNCGCGIEPLTEARPVTPVSQNVAVHQHGELGPVLGSAEHDFTTAALALS